MPLTAADAGEFADLVRARLSLEERFRRLADLFAAAAGPLAGGRLPDVALDEELAGARATFSAFAAELATHDGRPAPADLPEASARLAALIAAHSVASMRRRLVEEIGELLRLAHRSDDSFAPLLSFRERLLRRRAECEQAATREHLDAVEPNLLPFRDLYGAVTRPDDLDEHGLERIHTSFGPHVVLALMRNRLVLADLPTSASGGGEPPECVAPPEGPCLRGLTSPVRPDEGAEPPTPAEAREQAVEAYASAAPVALPDVDSGHSSLDEAFASELLPLAVPLPFPDEQPGEEIFTPVEVVLPLDVPAIVEPPSFVPAPAPPADLGDASAPVEAFGPALDAASMAAAVRAGSTPRGWAIENLAWRLLADDRPGLAHHLGRCLWDDVPSLAMPPALPRAVAVSPLIRAATGDAVEDLRKSVADLQDFAHECQSGQTPRHLAGRMLLLCVALRPALLAPAAAADSLLLGLTEGGPMPGLERLADAVRSYALLNLELTPALLKGVQAHASWQDEMQAHCEQARAWLANNRQSKLIYAHTTNVWHRWLDDKGPIGQAMRLVINDDRARADEVRAAVAEWSVQKHAERHLARTDQDLRKGGAKQRPIDARAQTAIVERCKQFADLAGAWLELLRAEPSARNDYRFEQADKCRTRVRQLLHPARQDVLDFIARNDTLPSAAAAAAATRLLDDLTTLFDADAGSDAVTLSPGQVINRELLGVVGLPLSPSWEPLVEPGVLLGHLLTLIEHGPHDVRAAFAVQRDALDHQATGRILDVARADGIDVGALAVERQEALAACRAALGRQIAHTRLKIERAVCYDLVGEAERGELSSVLQGVVPDEVLDFMPVIARLKEIDQTLDDRRRQRIEEVKGKLGQMKVKEQNPEAYSLVEQALAKEDFLTALEYFHLIETGQTPHGEGEPRRFVLREFFPAFVNPIETFLSGERGRKAPHWRDLIEQVRQRRGFGPLELRNVRPKQADEAAAMLEAWHALKHRLGPVEDSLRDLLKAIGFLVRSVSAGEGIEAPHQLLKVQTDPIANQEVCLTSRFGSDAGGQYEVLCLYDRPHEQRVVELARKASPHGTPLIALYVGRMTETGRRDLARYCWQYHRSFLVIDECLIYFLCGERFDRLPVLFGCSFPFTVAELYVTTASLVPVEMFFGRDRERREVFSAQGTNLVYGGRQLGKTALLRDVERRYRDLDRGIVVRWIDLKKEDVGYDRPADDVWAVLGKALQTDGVFPGLRFKAESVGEGIQEWLKGDPARRIVLLLDEADEFLKADSTPTNPQAPAYRNVARLKGIMDDTQRRFKVVFAGLHNVQRTARDPNSPIGHLGLPICIGPLLETGEWRAARDLIERPLMHVGFELDPDVAFRILSHTNYYPSLIQIFCKGLLKRLYSMPNRYFTRHDVPPYRITVQDVEETYQQSNDVRDEIRHRFNLTLDLDKRYRLIALCIAHATVEGRGQRPGEPEGFDVTWVRDEATYWWAKGFEEDSSYEMFRTILDEMVGLGVLRRVQGERYVLRSPNILNLLGNKEQIERGVVDVSLSVAPPQPEATTFRRALREDDWLRSPLTAQQEATLLEAANGVSVLFGSPIAGLERVVPFLREVFPGEALEHFTALTDRDDFVERLAMVYESKPEGKSLLVVDPGCSWDASWLCEALDYLSGSRGKARKNTLRVLFLAGPARTWEYSGQSEGEQQDLASAGVRETSLRPWNVAAMQRWMLDAGFGPTHQAGLDQFMKVTGGWGELLHAVGCRCKESPQNWAAHLEGLAKTWAHDEDWRKRFGFVEGAVGVLRVLAEMGSPLSEQEIADLLGAETAAVSQAVRWADRLQYVRKTTQGNWELDGIVKQAALAIQ